jgi:hypothetical protein
VHRRRNLLKIFLKSTFNCFGTADHI